MPDQPVARLTDLHACPVHGGGPVIEGVPKILVAGLPASTITHKATCVGPPDFIVTGAVKVLFGGKPVARMGDTTMHGGKISLGCLKVVIGSGSAGATLGAPAQWGEIFEEIAEGRESRSLQQSYGNCGVESVRQILLACADRMSEDELLQEAIDNGWADSSDDDPIDWGGTTSSTRQKLLGHHEIESTLEVQTRETILQAIAEQRGIVTTHNVAILWGDSDEEGSHAICPTGAVYDKRGHLTSIIINDSGTGERERIIPASTFFDSLWSERSANITSETPIDL